MNAKSELQVTAFEGTHRVASGDLIAVAETVRTLVARGGTTPVLVFDDRTGVQVDVTLRGRSRQLPAKPDLVRSTGPRGVGRPRPGFRARKVNLHPRHWEWLGRRLGGASAALRRLIDRDRKENAEAEKIRVAREALFRFMTAMGGDAPNYEEAQRALFAGDSEHFWRATSGLADDIREHVGRMAPAAFGMSSPFEFLVPSDKREAALHAANVVLGATPIESVERIAKGLSGAGVFRITSGNTPYLLKIQGEDRPLDPPQRDRAQRYACLKIAAEAQVTPPLLYADAEHGIAITSFIETNQVESGPAKTDILRTVIDADALRAVVDTVKTLHSAPLFPGLINYLDGVNLLMDRCQETGILPDRILDRYRELFATLIAVYPRNDSDLVSSHNDLNPGNVLFEGGRAWLVDWEAAFAADRYVDLAAIANFFAEGDSERDLILQRYFGEAITTGQRARLFLMRQANRLGYAMVLLNGVAAEQPERRLTVNDLFAVEVDLDDGSQISPNDIKLQIACTLLNEALHDLESARFVRALTIVSTSQS